MCRFLDLSSFSHSQTACRSNTNHRHDRDENRQSPVPHVIRFINWNYLELECASANRILSNVRWAGLFLGSNHTTKWAVIWWRAGTAAWSTTQSGVSVCNLRFHTVTLGLKRRKLNWKKRWIEERRAGLSRRKLMSDCLLFLIENTIPDQDQLVFDLR